MRLKRGTQGKENVMDAVEYLEEKQRMCDKSSCIHCPLGRTYRNSEDSVDVFIRKSCKAAA